MDLLQTLLRAAAFALGVWLVGSTFLSAVRTFVVPRSQNTLITGFVFGTVRRLFNLVLGQDAPYKRVDAVMALYAPMALLVLPAAWITLIMGGFALVYWGLGVETLGAALVLSGSSVLTLGFAPPPTPLITAVTLAEAAMGLLLTALLIAYLPTMYAAFQRREQAVNLLEVRAGAPPSALTLFERLHRLGRWSILHDQWIAWEIWFVDVEESHTSLSALNFFRSPQPDHSWVVAAGTILDAAALAASTLAIQRDVQADLCIRSGYLALRRIADFFEIPYPEHPSPDGPLSVSRAEFDAAYDELASYGIPLKPDRDRAWLDFRGWRVNYEVPLIALARLTLAPEAPCWTGRLGPGDGLLATEEVAGVDDAVRAASAEEAALSTTGPHPADGARDDSVFPGAPFAS